MIRSQKTQIKINNAYAFSSFLFKTLISQGGPMINKFTALLLCSLIAVLPAQARFSDGMVVGGIAGLATGLIAAGAMANCAKNCSNDVVVVEQPVIVEQPVVVYEEAPVVYQEHVVYEPVVRKTSCDRRAELAWREEKVRRAEIKQQRKEWEAQQRQFEESRRAKLRRAPKDIVKKTIVETRTLAPRQDADLKSKELAIREKQMELDLINKRTELLREENRKKELAIKEKELEIKRSKAKKDAENIQEEIVTKTVTRSAAA